MTVVKEDSYYFLDDFFLSRRKLLLCVFEFCILHSGPERGNDVLVGLVLGCFRDWMAKLG